MNLKKWELLTSDGLNDVGGEFIAARVEICEHVLQQRVADWCRNSHSEKTYGMDTGAKGRSNNLGQLV